jgi:hypothetical protein
MPTGKCGEVLATYSETKVQLDIGRELSGNLSSKLAK